MGQRGHRDQLAGMLGLHGPSTPTHGKVARMNTLAVLILCSFCGAVGYLYGRYRPRFRPQRDERMEPMAWRRGSGW